MQELMFALKTFALTALIIFAMQFKMGERTIESHTNQFITESRFSLFVQDVAKGAVKGIKNLGQMSEQFVSDVTADTKNEQK